ncbi:MAG: ABC transporter ATP-binding protein, partial [Bacillota bacterium]
QVYYGGIHALKGISFNVPEGKIISLIGANGAGKSTTLKAICNLVKPQQGEIFFAGQSIKGLPTNEIIKKGITLVPEGRHVFSNLTVLENLYLGAYARKEKHEVQKDLERVFELFPRLKERLKQSAGTLSGGEQQMLAVGRALMSRPRLLMMDEPSLGLAPLLVKNIFEIIKEINRQGVTVLLIEQNAMAALELADYAYVLETGVIVLAGTGAELIVNKSVREAYLGETR